MEEYTTQRKLRTYSVNIQLLWDIEEHIMKKMPAILPSLPGDPPLEGHTTLLLSSHAGTEYFTPVTKFTQHRFDNDIEKIALEFNYSVGQHVNERQAMMLTIQFTSYSGDTDLSLTLRTQGAREKAIDLERSLLQKLEQNKNNNWIAYPNELISTVIFVGGFLAFLFALMSANPILKTICILLFAGAFYLIMHRFMKGYCSFDSNRQKRLDSIFKLAVIIVAAFLTVTILTPLRNLWWGF